jgi:Phage tail assembly chaperone proteins, E, or 41 or 14
MQQDVKRPREGFQFDDGAGDGQTVEVVEPDSEVNGASVLSDEWPITVKLLHKPIRNGKGEEIDKLTFREPSGSDINRVGNPVRINQEGEIIIDDKRMLVMMANLSGVLSPLLERMDPRDYNSAAYRLRNFFIPDLAAWLP